VAEEFALVKLARDRRAIDADERLLAAAAALVDFAGDQFLAGARFAQDQHGSIRGRHQVNLPLQLLEARALADDVAQALASRTSSRR